MVDQFSQIPPSGRSLDPATAQAKSEQPLQVTGARGELQTVKRAIRTEGTIVRVTPDNTATIRTPQGGEVDVRIRNRGNLSEGQRVEIDLPPGSPPRQAIVRAAQQQPQQPPAPLPQATSTTQHQQSGIHRVTPPPVQADLRAVIDDLAPPPPQPPATSAPAELTQETIVRLQPLHNLPAEIDLQALPATSAALTASAFKDAYTVPSLPPGSVQTRPAAVTSLPPVQALQIPDGAVLKPLTAIKLNPFAQTPAPDKNLALLRPVMHQSIGIPVPTFGKPDELLAGEPPLSSSLKTGPLPLLGIPDVPIMSTAIETKLLPSDRLDARIMVITPHHSLQLVGQDSVTSVKDLSSNLTASAPALRAEVIGLTHQNQPVLSVFWPGSAEPFPALLQFPANNLSIGTQIELLPHAISHAPAIAAAPFTPATELFSSWSWPAMDDALQLLNPAGQAATVQTLMKALPNPANPAQMGPALLFFMAAARAGDLSSWMGEKAINALRREGARGSDLLARLTRDFSGLSKMASEPISQDWRGMVIPMYVQGEIQKMNLLYRHQGGDEKDDPEQRKDRSTRFIFDIDFGRLGPVQLDGLMKDKRFDLILRTQTAFSHAMQTTMRKKYLDIIDAGGLTGDLAFQTRADQWVKVDIRQTALKTSV